MDNEQDWSVIISDIGSSRFSESTRGCNSVLEITLSASYCNSKFIFKHMQLQLSSCFY